MKLLFLLNSLRVSGTEKLMISLAKLLENNGHQVFLFPLITPFDKDFISSMQQDGKKLNILFPTIILKFDKFFWKLNGFTQRLFNWSFRSFFLRKYLSHKCRRIGIDLVVSNLYEGDSMALFIHRSTGVKYVIVDHGSYVSFIIEKISFDQTPIDHASAVIGVSRWTVETLKARFPARPVELVYNGYVKSSEGPVPITLKDRIDSKNHFVFCMHGRASEQKGWDIAIQAFFMIKKKGYKIKLIILSEGDYIDTLKEHYGYEADLIFAGFHYNLTNIFEFVDIGLLLSKKFETFGLSALDYFHNGLPVIASNVGGLPEVVHAGELQGGFLINTDGQGSPIVEEVVSKMECLIIDKKLYDTFSRNAKLIVLRFSIENCVNNYKDLFENIIAN